MVEFVVHKLAANIGAKLIGLDLSKPLSEKIIADIRKVWLDNAVVVFPNQTIDDTQHVEFSKRFGTLELINMSALQMDGRPEIYEATNLDKNDRILVDDHPILTINRGNQKWHSDSSFKLVPATASMLHAYIVPDRGGETEFANMTAAFEA